MQAAQQQPAARAGLFQQGAHSLRAAQLGRQHAGQVRELGLRPPGAAGSPAPAARGASQKARALARRRL